MDRYTVETLLNLHVLMTTLEESLRVLSEGLQECYKRVSESTIRGSLRVLSEGLQEYYQTISTIRSPRVLSEGL